MKEGNYLFSKDGEAWNNSLKQRKEKFRLDVRTFF